MQGREIEALQAEKDSLLKENKGIKRTIWDWKQTLYAEAEANPHEALVSLASLKSIYGDVVTSKALVASGNFSASIARISIWFWILMEHELPVVMSIGQNVHL